MRLKIKSLMLWTNTGLDKSATLMFIPRPKHARTGCCGPEQRFNMQQECTAQGCATSTCQLDWREGVILIPGVEDIKPHSPISFNSSGT